MDIKKVSILEMGKIIETREPRGMFYCIENKRYVGCDNRTGDAWTEDFSSLDRCKRWLRK